MKIKRDVKGIYIKNKTSGGYALWDKTIISDSTSGSSGVIASQNGKFTRTSYSFGGGNGNYGIGTDNGHPAILVTGSHGNCNVGISKEDYNELIKAEKIKIVYTYFRIGSNPSSYQNSVYTGPYAQVYLNSSGVHTDSKRNAFTFVNDGQYSLIEEIETSDMSCTATLTNLITGVEQTTTYTKEFNTEASSTYKLVDGPDIIRLTRDAYGSGVWGGDIEIYTGGNPLTSIKAVYIKRPEPKKWTPGENTLVYMPLDGDVKDYSGNNNNGTITGEVSLTNTIGDKKYAEFNGGAIDLTTLPVSGNQTFTHSARMKLNSSGVSHMHLFGRDYNGSRSNVIVGYSNNHRPLQDTYQIDVYMGDAIPTSWYGTWKHCVYVHDGSSNKIYIDGVLYGEGSGSLNISTGYNKQIGRAQTDAVQKLYGMSESIIENKARTEAEVKEYFNATKYDYLGKPHDLPNDYQEVEYIQSNGNGTNTGPHINPGLTLTSGVKFKVEIKFQWLNSTTDERDIYAQYYGSTDRYQLGFISGGFQARLNSDTNGTLPATWTPNTYGYNNTYTVVSECTPSKTSSRPPFLFGQNEGDSYARWAISAKLYYFKARQNDVLKREMIPCYRKSDNVIGLYDLVNNTFYTNSGSGAFTKGDDVGQAELIQIRPSESKIELQAEANFDSNDEVTGKGFVLNKTADRYGVTCSGGHLVVNAGSYNDAGGSCTFDVSKYDHWKAQARIYCQGTSRGGDQRFTVGGGELPQFRQDNNVIGHTMNLTTASGYTGPSGIGTGTSQGGEYGTYFTGTYVYEIEYNKGEYTITRYNDTDQVTEASTYTHRKTFTGGRAEYVGAWIRCGYRSENYNRVDWIRIYY